MNKKYILYITLTAFFVLCGFYYVLSIPENALATESIEHLKGFIICLSVSAFFYIKTLKHA